MTALRQVLDRLGDLPNVTLRRANPPIGAFQDPWTSTPLNIGSMASPMQTSLSIPQLSAAFCFALASCGPDNGKLSAPDDGMPAQDPKVTADAQIPYVHAAWKTGIAQNSVKLTSITSGDYADLLFLEQIIGNRRLVQLGESGHGVAQFNQVKVRLIKFLHEHMGFDVIAFESGLSECFFTNVNATAPSPAQMIGSVFRVWRTAEVLELFDYLVGDITGAFVVSLRCPALLCTDEKPFLLAVYVQPLQVFYLTDPHSGGRRYPEQLADTIVSRV